MNPEDSKRLEMIEGSWKFLRRIESQDIDWLIERATYPIYVMVRTELPGSAISASSKNCEPPSFVR